MSAWDAKTLLIATPVLRARRGCAAIRYYAALGNGQPKATSHA
jgi:hypothetical protein